MAKVAHVVPPYEIAFNVGTKDGVKEGDIAVIFNHITIQDPDSGDLLGTIKRPLVTLQIVEVSEQLCVGETTESVYRPDDTTFLMRVRRRQRVTPSSAERNWVTVYVQIGEEAEITTPEEEEPF
jgi:hypothetical protein